MSVDIAVLADGYYVANFQALLDTVRERYDDLLTADELAFAASFDDLSDAPRRLYVRLISRKGPCFREDLLSYDDVPYLSSALGELERSSLLDRGQTSEPADVLATLRKDELVGVALALGADRAVGSLRRAEIEAGLAQQPGALRVALDRWPIVRPLGVEHVRVFRLLFFGNLGQDLSEFVLRDLGIVRYEDYSLDRELRLFEEREGIDHLLALREHRHTVGRLLLEGRSEEALELGEVVSEGARQGAWHRLARRHADRLLNQLGRDLERAGRDEEALGLYGSAEEPPARERRVRVLERLGRLGEARELCEAMAREPRDETERDAARVIGRRLSRKLGLGKGSPKRQRRVVELELEADPERPVEELVAEHLEAEGKVVLRSENWLWRSLFGLAFWDIVFQPLPGAFEHPFQSGPLDLHTADFRLRRVGEIEARLSELRSEGDLKPRLLPVYEAKYGVVSSLVVWHPDLQPTLLAAMDIVQGPDLALVADRLSRDLGRYRRGLPDLLVSAPDAADGEQRLELWEVKGPGDQLRAEQKAWIDYFDEVGIPARVAKVSWH